MLCLLRGRCVTKARISAAVSAMGSARRLLYRSREEVPRLVSRSAVALAQSRVR